MDRDRPSRQTAMRLRADEAMKAALSAEEASAPSSAAYIEDAMRSIDLVRQDCTLDPRDRLLLIDDMLPLIASLKRLLRAAQPEQIMEVGRRTNGLLRRYARILRAKRAGS